ncbi:ubiquitin-conjugating enzyme E2 U isoform X2 [Oryctolagus cuniculus]|uniref:ubiquitin-conjugating enzyme E2 U isoform X2 n=1 Tax=Oryctolagus cuniculus TaxID=9986 RepID=UPI00387A7A5F
MNRRVFLLLEKHFQEFRENNYTGITAFPTSEDMMEWEAEIEGLQDSMWQGLIFELTIDFTPEYNFVPPVVKFRTIPFHPNVDPYTGQPCIDFLDNPEKWNTSYTLSSILLTLQVMLSNPGLEQPVNLEAAQMLIENESVYRTLLQRLFHKSCESKDDGQELPKDSQKLSRYAATKARFARETRMHGHVSPSTKRMHRLPTTIDDAYPESQTNSDVTDSNEKEAGWKSEASSFNSDTEEDWEEEVDDLVAWTNTLNTEALEEQA